MMVFIADERLHLGAEAEVWSGSWMGRSAVSKQRRSRQWRHPNLDKRLGVRRMVSEAKILMRLHNAGIAVPQVWDLDVQGGRLVLQRMPGIPLIELLNNAETSDQLVIKALRNTGAAIRILHRQAITHGDLSTNNILIDEQGNSVLIDFGLAVMNALELIYMSLTRYFPHLTRIIMEQ
jgi:Kae1-associated kinase Bud32